MYARSKLIGNHSKILVPEQCINYFVTTKMYGWIGVLLTPTHKNTKLRKYVQIKFTINLNEIKYEGFNRPFLRPLSQRISQE